MSTSAVGFWDPCGWGWDWDNHPLPRSPGLKLPDLFSGSGQLDEKHSLSQEMCPSGILPPGPDMLQIEVHMHGIKSLVSKGSLASMAVPLGTDCLCHPHKVPCKETGVAQAGDLF